MVRAATVLVGAFLVMPPALATISWRRSTAPGEKRRSRTFSPAGGLPDLERDDCDVQALEQTQAGL